MVTVGYSPPLCMVAVAPKHLHEENLTLGDLQQINYFFFS